MKKAIIIDDIPIIVESPSAEDMSISANTDLNIEKRALQCLSALQTPRVFFVMGQRFVSQSLESGEEYRVMKSAKTDDWM